MKMVDSRRSEEFTSGYSSLPPIVETTNKQRALIAQRSAQISNSLEDLHLCHVTSYFPEEGVIYPRLTYEIEFPEKHRKLQNTITEMFSVVRPTVHFVLNSIVQPHTGYESSRIKRIIIIDSLKDNIHQISGGYIEDVFCVGPYKLSNHAIILVPEESRELYHEKVERLGRRLQVQFYSGSEKQAVEDSFLKHHIKHITPVESDPEIPNYFGWLGEGQAVSSQAIMQSIKAPFCSHDITPTAQIEAYISGNAVGTVHPFLKIIEDQGPKIVSENVIKYIQSSKRVYKLSEMQSEYLERYQKVMLLCISILFSSKDVDSLVERFEIDRDIVLNYDLDADFTRRIDPTSTIKRLNHLTGLSFSAYYRKKCDSIIDAGAAVPSEEGQRLMATMKGLTPNSTLQQDGSEFYLVVRGINLPEVAEDVLKRCN